MQNKEKSACRFFKTLVVLALLTPLLNACASLSDQGNKALQNGEYEKALSLFEKATLKEPDNGDAKEGLQKARQKWLSQKLIEVRLFRLSGNLGDSESLLIKIIQQQSKWQVFPTGVAFSTQNEEIQFVSERIQQRLQNFIKIKNPIGAQVELNKNSFLLGYTKSENLSQLRNQIFKEAQAFCRDQKKSLKQEEYYTSQWLVKTCQIWEVQVSLPKVVNPIKLFKDVQIQSEIKSLDPKLKSVLDESLRFAFLKSSWADKNGQDLLALSSTGQFSSLVKETPVKRTKEYTVEIPYEETFTRLKDKNKNAKTGGVLAILDLLAGTSEDEKVRDNGDGTETVTVKRYRTEFRTHSYPAVHITALKDIRGQIQAELAGQAFKSEFDQRFNLTQDRHDENFPDIGLTPENPSIISDEGWIKTIAQEILSDVQAQLQDTWIDRFCKSPQKADTASEREVAHRCAYQAANRPPQFLQQYYLKTWGVSFDDWRSLTLGPVDPEF